MFHRIMEASSTWPREEPIAVPDSDSAEQEEPQHSAPEITTTTGNTEDNTNNTESQPIANPQTEGLARVEMNELGPTTQDGGDAMKTPTTAERNRMRNNRMRRLQTLMSWELPRRPNKGKAYKLTRPRTLHQFWTTTNA